ncbi:MAG: helix-turn-helix transcriptional regulator [Emergencia sp.]|nr:helix-turn-helix transcriptional regulator [Emergencia sp.]
MKLDHAKLDIMRARKLLTTSQLAKIANVSTATIVRKNKNDVNVITIGKIAKALGVDPEEIIVKE